MTVTFDDGDIPYRSDIIIITLSALEIAFCIILELVPGDGGGGGGSHMKGVGMLVVSPRGVNFGFWSHLGCSEQNAIIFSREGLV